LFVLAWFIPLAVGQPFLRAIVLSEHTGCERSSDPYANTRTTYTTPLVHFLMWDMPFHAEHHRYPAVPFHALGRLHDSQFAATSDGGNGKRSADDFPVADYITLGPVGTAFLPFQRPRVLLIDELDKSDLQLPNELLNLLEEGEYEIPQLIREARRPTNKDSSPVRTHDPGATAHIHAGRVRCHEFPIVVMTRNRERDFPAAFHRRCIRVEMPAPTNVAAFKSLVRKHFEQQNRGELADKKNVLAEIITFLDKTKQEDRATDQLLNVLHLLTQSNSTGPTEEQIETLRSVLYKGLRSRDGSPEGR
jgi:MoxR-like ATPase